ncbi:MAG TPA: alpha-amylase family protein [Bryobacteraceae bacterium]|jgi:hypothetical protein|nr:alpha-amylase family protein [Bryobacteraceae bacterium]
MTRRTALEVLLSISGSPSTGTPANERWWDRESLRIVDVASSLSDINLNDPAAIAAKKAALGFNAEHLEIMRTAGGLDDEHFYFATKIAGKQNPDYLKRYLPEAKKRGIRSLIYFNVHWYSRAFGAKHPDWLQIRENGTPLDGVYDTGTDFCINAPWREWCFQILRDLAAYLIDGIFYDGPVFRPDTCYCRYCREKFRKIYGKDLPSKRVRRGKDFQELLQFQANSIAAYLRDSQTVLKSINRNLALYMNGGVRGANWATGRLNRVLIPQQDLLGSEGGFLSGDLTRVPLWKASLTARLLETQSSGKPRVIFSAASHKPWTFSLLPGAELRLLYAATIANAANVWFGITPFDFGQPEMQGLAAMNHFLARNASYYQNTQSTARVAVVWSDITANFYAGSSAQLIDIDRVRDSSNVGDLDSEFSGITEALLRAHVPFDVVDDTTLERGPIDRYAAVFLPNVACMSDKVANRLRDYVRKGGNLFATFETSRYDDTGMARPDFALADLFGASTDGKVAGPTRWDFMKAAASDPLLNGLKREMIPSTVYHVRVSLKNARALLYLTKPLAGRYDGVPAVSDEPALMEQEYGKGRTIFFSGDLGAAIQNFHMPEWLSLVANAAREMAPAPIWIEGAPGSVEVVLRSQEQQGRFLIHLVNYTGGMTRPIQSVVPVENVRISVNVPGTFRRAFTLYHPQELALATDSRGSLQFSLPRLDEYEVIVLQK